jgi:hypothetical protein
VEYELVNCMYACPPTLWGRQVKDFVLVSRI